MKFVNIGVLLVLIWSMPSVCANRHNESGFLKKAIRVIFYGAEVGAGWHFLTVFHNRSERSLLPWEVTRKIWNDPKCAGSEALAAFMLLRHGLRGLNRELHITEQFKR